MNRHAILLIPAQVFGVICILLFVLLLMKWAVQSRMLSKAGVSNKTPGCSNCMYIVRGWESSVCPECGTDVIGTKVRTGVDLNKKYKYVLAFGIAVVLVLFCILPFGGWLFDASSHSGNWSLRSTGSIVFNIQVILYRDFSRFPPKKKSAPMLMKFKSDAPIELNDHFPKDQHQIEKLEYWESRGYKVVYFDNAKDIPTDEEMSVFLSEALGHDENVIKPYAAEINDVLRAVIKIDKGQSFNVSSNAPSFEFFNNRPGRDYDLWTPGIYITLLSSLIIVCGLPAYVAKRHKPGTRPVQSGEWLTSVTTQGTAD